MKLWQNLGMAVLMLGLTSWTASAQTPAPAFQSSTAQYRSGACILNLQDRVGEFCVDGSGLLRPCDKEFVNWCKKSRGEFKELKLEKDPPINARCANESLFHQPCNPQFKAACERSAGTQICNGPSCDTGTCVNQPEVLKSFHACCTDCSDGGVCKPASCSKGKCNVLLPPSSGKDSVCDDNKEQCTAQPGE